MSTQMMKLELVQLMTDNYKSKQLVSITTNPAIPMDFDATAVWFGLDELKNFINTIETETAKYPEYGLKNFGIRFYYAAYPEDVSLTQTDAGIVPKKYAKLHTLILIPTAEMEGVNTDFDPYNKDTYDGTKPTVTGCTIMAENHGDSFPPTPNNGLLF